MKETRYKNVQRQITNLISLIELCLPFTEELNNTKERLNFLPGKLEYLKKQAEYLKQKTSYSVNTKDSTPYSDRLEKANSYSQSSVPRLEKAGLALDRISRSEIENTELELDFLVTNLEDTLTYLELLKKQISDLVVLRERVEALQEERLVGITPERIYKLIEKQQLENSLAINDKPSEEKNHFERVWQKIAEYKYSKKIVKSTAIAAGVILCFGLGSYSSIKDRIDENTLQVEQTEQLRKTPTDI